MFEKIRSALSSNRSRPYHLFQIEPTLLCNLRCIMCPWIEQRATGGTMDWDTFSKIADNLHLTEEVDLTGGGEPLCNPLLPEMVRVVKSAGCKVGFSTNGVGLSQTVAEKLVKLGLDWISFSVDAAEAKTYEAIRQGAQFDLVRSNIAALHQIKRTLSSHTPKMMMVFVLMTGETENYHQLPDFIELAHQLGVEQVIAKNLDVILKDGDDQRRLFSHDEQIYNPLIHVFEQAEQRARKLGVKLRRYSVHPSEQIICEQAPLHNLFFSWDGSVSPCITLSYAESRIYKGERILIPCQRFGNINQQTLAEIWDHPSYRAFRKMYEARQLYQRQLLMDTFLGSEDSDTSLPAAPQGCQSCYYLYGI